MGSEERREAKVEVMLEPEQAAAVSSCWHMSPAELVWPFFATKRVSPDDYKVAGYKTLLHS